MTLVYSILIAQSVVIVILAVLVVGLLRSHAATLRTLDQLGAASEPSLLAAARPHPDQDHAHEEGIPQPGGELQSNRPAPDLVGIDPGGETAVISTSNDSGPLLLAFLSTSCSSCSPFWEAFDSGRMAINERTVRAVAVTLGPEEESPTRAAKASPGARVLMSSDAWARYGVPGAPYFVLVDTASARVLGEGSAATPAQLGSLVADATADQVWDLRRSKKMKADLARESKIDEELMRAGITPGDAQLYPDRGEIAEEEPT